MKIAVNTTTGKTVWMNQNFAKGDDFICNCCSKPVVPHCGQIVAWHFKHKATFSCELSEKSNLANSMSEFHRRFQEEFHKMGAELEKRFKKNIADVFYKKRVFEIQNSPIQTKEIVTRSKNYQKTTKKFPIWILNMETQNLNNYPKNYLKILVSDNEIRFHHNELSFSVFDHNTMARTVQICSDLKALKLLFDEEKERYKNRQLALKNFYKSKELYEPFYKYSRSQNEYFINPTQTIQNIVDGDKLLLQSANHLSREEKTILQNTKNETFKNERIERELFLKAFKSDTKIRNPFVKLALEVLAKKPCSIIQDLETIGVKHKGKKVHQMDDKYGAAMVRFYFSKKLNEENEQYYRNLLYSMLKLRDK